MHVKKRPYNWHSSPVVSRRSVNRFIAFGLRIVEARPVHYFHQTLTFPNLIKDSKQAKSRLMRLFKSATKAYAKFDLVIFYVQERRDNGGIHYHVCFLFWRDSEGRLPFPPSLMYKDFRADIFRRWNALNGYACVHSANSLKEHNFDIKTLDYFAKVKVVAKLSTRAETNWWGLHNRAVLLRRSTEPGALKIATAFEEMFRKSAVKFPRKPSACNGMDNQAPPDYLPALTIDNLIVSTSQVSEVML